MSRTCCRIDGGTGPGAAAREPNQRITHGKSSPQKNGEGGLSVLALESAEKALETQLKNSNLNRSSAAKELTSTWGELESVRTELSAATRNAPVARSSKTVPDVHAQMECRSSELLGEVEARKREAEQLLTIKVALQVAQRDLESSRMEGATLRLHLREVAESLQNCARQERGSSRT